MAQRHTRLFRAALFLLAVPIVAVSACGTPTRPQAAARPSARPSVTASSRPTAPASGTPSPKPSTSRKPAPPHKKHKPGPVTGSASAASLDIPGAGTLRIPAWPNQPGRRWRGPVGSQGSTGTSSVALTFDDGPGPYTSRVLDLLDKYHIKATFCMIGEQIHAYRSVVKRMIKDGMTLCDHTWDHDEQLWHHDAPYVADDMQKMIDAVHAIDPKAQVTYFRNPGGNFSKGTVRVCELLGMRPLYWSVDTADWTRPGTATIEHTIRTHAHRDSIVLMHDGGGDRSETLAALRQLLPQLRHEYHLIALPTARTVRINPGRTATPPAPPSAPPSAPASPPPADAPAQSLRPSPVPAA